MFGLGDVAGIPASKTGAAIRKQAPVLVENLLSYMKEADFTGWVRSWICSGLMVTPIITPICLSNSSRWQPVSFPIFSIYSMNFDLPRWVAEPPGTNPMKKCV